MSYITIMDIALARGVQKDPRGGYSSSEFKRVGLSVMGGCVRCQATLAAYNAYPGRCGYWLCKSCVENDGFETVDQFEQYTSEAEWLEED